jgi:hypothetical protein
MVLLPDSSHPDKQVLQTPVAHSPSLNSGVPHGSVTISEEMTSNVK